jgi:valyl-tRNA synthetase
MDPEGPVTPTELPARFEPGPIEAHWQAFWADRGLFRAPEGTKGPGFTLALPPPNVTGILTIGHMLGDTIMDTLVRWHRMRGEPTLWIPGVDHAGLATEIEVRKRLARQGSRPEAMGREELLGHVEAWKQEHERRILEQLRAGGFSLDRSRYRYTMDEGFRRATRHAFVRLYEEGLIYRGERIVNWDPRLRTAISDLEVLRKEEPAVLLYLRYPWADGAPGGLVVATVRPETIFGDIAVAVHPDDDRHRAAVGRSVRVPMTDRSVPVIADALVDPQFGNGALKLTPGHDPLDFQIARRHPELPTAPSVLDAQARLAGPWVPERYRGMDVPAARAATREELSAGGFLEREEAYVHSVGRSERSDAVVEPLLSTQWFVRMSSLAVPAVAAVQDGTVRLHPDRWAPTFFRWMEALEDWCISRQVSWGHPIPVSYCEGCGREIVREETPTTCPSCGGLKLRADPDVLDTWFTSWLWPFATLGWPEPTSDLARYYPTSVLVTGRDILFFWVARMIMAGYHFTGRAPFSDVYFTGMLRDEEGRRMSKHLGNSPDPLEVIRRWGADATRLSLLFPNPTDQDGPFREANLEAARNFLTKLWNVARLLAAQLPEGTSAPDHAPELGPDAPLEDRWILARWRRTASELEGALAAFEFTRALGLLREFLWHDVADRYVEIAKEALGGRKDELAARRSRSVLLFVLERTLRQLHPMAPHVTEELWHALPHEGASLAVAPWPRPEEAPDDPAAELAMAPLLEAVRGLRLLRSENDVPQKSTPAAWARPVGAEAAIVLRQEAATVRRLARVTSFEVLPPEAPPPPGSLAYVAPVGELYLERPAESARSDWETLLRERSKVQELRARTLARLADPGFRSRAPPEVVREAEAKAEELAQRLRRLEEHLAGPSASSGVAEGP